MLVIHPLTRRGVALLARTRVEPWQVVVAHSLIGLAAAAAIAGTNAAGWVAAAVLLQVKTLLDNMDGGLARATNRVTELGRYLDTGLDFVVNVALFAALAAHGQASLSLLALVVLTVVLSFDHNAERLYREALREPSATAVADGGSGSPHALVAPAAAGESVAAGAAGQGAAGAPDALALRAFRGLYRALFAPQDAAIARLDARLFELAGGLPYADATPAERRAWSDLASTGALVNLGLSTQYVALGVCLLARAPFAYVYLVLAQGVYLVVVQLLRVRAYRRRRLRSQAEPPGRR